MKYGEWTMGQTEALLNKLGGMDVALGILRGVIEVTTKVINFITHTFKMAVDRTKTLAEMISAAQFDWVNENITQENFPVDCNSMSEEDLAIFHFNRNISSENAIAEMDKAGYEPSDIADLLALGKSQPKLQRQFPIVALKSVWRNPLGYRNVPVLYSYAGKRCLHLYFFDDDWDDRYRVLARRKYQKPLDA